MCSVLFQIEPALQAIATSSWTVLIIWSPGVESQSGSYLMRYHGQNHSTEWSRERTIDEGDTPVTGLFPGAQYTFEVTMVRDNTENAYFTVAVVMCEFMFM